MPAGRPSKPTALKLLNGNPGHRPINTREPVYEVHSGRAPEGMTGEALKEWNRRAPILIQQGLFTAADELMLVAWCEAWSDFVEARETLESHRAEHGSYDAVGQGGSIVMHPAYRRKANASDRLAKLSPRFGFSPSDRARIETPEGKTEGDVLARFQRHA